ncbi:MAG: transcriptional regulator, MarR family [Marmoricola sp.]|nr:transcriptional regulator, MarR family [Marmoricola sp.]
MTPQAMSELVDHLVPHGYLERMPDPSDRRAKLIVLTDLGYEALQDAFDTIIGIEADLEVLLGRAGLVQFRRVLSQVAELRTG